MINLDHTERKLRFGIMCHGTRFPAWQAQCIRHLLASGVAEPVLLVIDSDRRHGRVTQPREAGRVRPVLYWLYERLWIRRRLRALRRVDLTSQLADVPSIACATIDQCGCVDRLSTKDIAEIRDHHLDFILQFAFASVGSDIATAARFGIWTYHRGYEHQYGGLAAFWAFYRGESVHRAMLLRLTDEPGSAILHCGSFRAQWSCAKTTDATLFGGAEWCARVCREVALGQFGQAQAYMPSAAECLYRLPANREFALFLWVRLMALVRGTFRHLFLLEYWNIGISEMPIDQIVAAGRPSAVRWLPPPSALHYHADPFVLCARPEVILVEEYSHALGQGWISWISLAANGNGPRRIEVFESGVHRSYPFLFCDESTIFCVPECAEERRVDLYRAIRFPDLWQRAGTLIEDFLALDSTVFYHDGRWWLMCTSGQDGGEHKLHAWHAGALSGPWQPHPLNPLKCDVTSSRPAGRPFLMDGKLCRPAQDCSRTYGGAVTINRVARLTPTEFAEAPVGRISPAADGRYGDGLHTICPVGRLTVIDGKCFVFDLRAPYLKARRKLGRRPAVTRREGNPLVDARIGTI
jgi:hypothetical protein